MADLRVVSETEYGASSGLFWGYIGGFGDLELTLLEEFSVSEKPRTTSTISLGVRPLRTRSKALLTKSVGCAWYTLATLEIASGIEAGAGDGTIASRNSAMTDPPCTRRLPSASRPAMTDSSCDSLVILEGIFRARLAGSFSGRVGVGVETTVVVKAARARVREM